MKELEARRRLLVLDTSYSFEAIRARGLEHSVTSRDLDGYFDHVWTVHPFATLVTSPRWTPRFGKPVEHNFAPRHTFIEGKLGRFAVLGSSAVNFLIGQIGLLARLKTLVRRERISVIRAGDPLYTGLFGLMLSRLTRVPLVIRVGGNHDKVFEATGKPLMPRLFRSRRLERRVERFVLKRADLVAGANKDNLDFALAAGARPTRTTLFRYGNLIHPSHFTDPLTRVEGKSLLRDLGVGDRPVMLYVGRLEMVKRPADVIRVLAAVRRAGFDVVAVLVGDGSERTVLEQLARELGVADSVFFAGNRDQNWISRVIPVAALVLSPHTGRALAETGLGAAPIVAYDVDWQSEVVTSGETGELVRYGDVDAMTSAAVGLLEDRPRAVRYGVNVRARMLVMMDPVRLRNHERQCYDQLLAGQR